MLVPILLGCATVFVTMTIQIAAVVWMLHYLHGLVNDPERESIGLGVVVYVLSVVMLMLFFGHLIQAAVWATLFQNLGEFTDFASAFYHSLVNFASLGYGDIVMSEKWRLLGAIEAANGVLMFGMSGGTLLSVTTYLLSSYTPLKKNFESMKKSD